MSIETDLADWSTHLTFDDLPTEVVDAMRLLTRTVIGTAVAGATSNGCAATVAQVMEWGGAPEATIWLYGGRAPAHTAALANSTMARALDICDAAAPGQHIGTSAVPVALAMAEQVGGVNGREFITALAAGSEIAARLGLVSRLDGFDPTGACSIFAPCIVAGRLLGLTEKQMLNAMALVFNKAGSSFQSNVDGSLAVRLIEGFISQDGIICAQLAKRDATGPRSWLSGPWGYYHLFCDDQRDDTTVAAGLGQQWALTNFGYKTRPQCGATISSTDAILDLLAAHPVEAAAVDRIDIHMASEATYTLVGSAFELGDHPQVNGQFNVRYCVANAIVRKSSQLQHFTNEAVSDPVVGDLARRIHTHLAPHLMAGRREFAARVALEVRLLDGSILTCGADGPSGFPPQRKTEAQHRADFAAHLAYGGLPLASANIATIVAMIESLEAVPDVRELAPLLVSAAA